MQTITLNLRSEVEHTSRNWFLIIVILFVVVVSTAMVLSKTSPILLGVALVINLLQAIVNWYYSKPILLTFDEHGMTGKIEPRKSILLAWNQIARLEFKMFTLIVRTNDGKEEEIDLSHITYEDHKKTKPQIIEMAKSKGIAVQTV
jgi:hypothetical protein